MVSNNYHKAFDFTGSREQSGRAQHLANHLYMWINCHFFTIVVLSPSFKTWVFVARLDTAEGELIGGKSDIADVVH